MPPRAVIPAMLPRAAIPAMLPRAAIPAMPMPVRRAPTRCR
jgi:hypothetical protein